MSSTTIVNLVEAVVSGGAVTWILRWLSERGKDRAYTMGAVDKAVQVAMQSLGLEVDRLNKEVDALRSEHHSCREQLILQEEMYRELKQQFEQHKEEVDGTRSSLSSR